MNGTYEKQNTRYHGNPRVIMWCITAVGVDGVDKMCFVNDAEVWFEPYLICKAAETVRKLHDLDDSFPLELEDNEEIYRDAAKKLTFGGDLENYNLHMLSPVSLKRMLDSLDPKKKFVFIKDMAAGMPPSRYQYLPDKSSGFKHFFLIRHPIKAYKSLRKGLLEFLLKADPESFPEIVQMPDPEHTETFHVINNIPAPRDGTPYNFKAVHELWSHIRLLVDEDPVILDIDDLLDDPSTMLPLLCNALGIPYSESHLTWDPSADVVLKWKSSCPNVRDAPRYAMWFTNAFKSSCFKASATKATLEDATDDVKEVVEKDMPFYEEMYNLRLTA